MAGAFVVNRKSRNYSYYEKEFDLLDITGT